MNIPAKPKIYHILHHDRLPNILRTGAIYSDIYVKESISSGTNIGLNNIKERRRQNILESHPDLVVGGCVPFYFCPRSVMLYLIYRKNLGLSHQEGQDPIVTLEFDLHEVRKYAEGVGKRWAFTTSNAGANVFQDYCSIDDLNKIRWGIIHRKYWSDEDVKTAKQSEFLVEDQVPWHLVERIGVHNKAVHGVVSNHMNGIIHRPNIEILPQWYY